jgi:RNA polymerase sigma-70 factor, ECF subfamily
MIMIRHTPDIELLRKGDKEEFAKIYYEFFDLLFALGYQYTKNHQVAEEMAQETFIGLWETRATLGTESNIRNWLYTVTKNKCLNHLRNELNATRHLNTIRAQELKFAEESMNSLGSNFAELVELQSRIGSAIAHLPADLQTVFDMNRYGGLTYGEIARELNLSEKAIEARMSKALKILKAALKDYFPILLIIHGAIS